MPSVLREFDFFIENNENNAKGSPSVSFHVEQLDNGTLRIKASLLDNNDNGVQETADIRGIFFHVRDIVKNDTADADWLANLQIILDGESAPIAKENRILKPDDVSVVPGGSNDDNMNGRPGEPYDVGIGIGTSGRSGDDVKEVTFILQHTDRSISLTLEHLIDQAFGARLTSVGAVDGSRGESLKLWGTAKPINPPSSPAPTGSIGDRVWLDIDKDGFQDENETQGVQGIVVKLYDANNVKVLETTTDANGNYLFEKVKYGAYTVDFVDNKGIYQLTTRDVSDNNNDDKDSDAAESNGAWRTGSYTINANNINITTVDAGIYLKEGSSMPDGRSYDDLIEGGDGDDRIYGGRGNDEIQGEGGNDTISGGTDYGKLIRGENNALSVATGDNLYGNDGNDIYHYASGDGVDLIWDFRPGEDLIKVTGFTGNELEVTYVEEVTNWIGTGNHRKLALIFGKDRGAIIFNDFPAPQDSHDIIQVGDQTFTWLKLKEMVQVTTKGAVIEGHVPDRSVPALQPSPIGLEVAGRNDNSLDILNGGDGADKLYGNNGTNWLDGAGGDDQLFGGNQADTLIGGEGRDRLYGNEGVNWLEGDSGEDELYGGNRQDTLQGGTERDSIYGNGGDDVIVGGEGSDKLYGAGGDDTIYGDDMEGEALIRPEQPKISVGPTTPYVISSDGAVVTTSVSYALSGKAVKLIAAAGSEAISLGGNKLNNVIIGNDGENTICGGGGKDTLVGMGGGDTFIFNNKASKSNVDKIVDFDIAADKIMLDNKYYKKLGKNGSEDAPAALKKSFLKVGSKAKDSNDHLIYNSKKGILYYDPDGSGEKDAIVVAKLSKYLKLSEKDILVC